MSAILKGLLEAQIKPVLAGFGEKEYTGPSDSIAAQNRFVTQLSQAIAVAVQQYINANVVTTSDNGPDSHNHRVVAP